MKGLAKYLNKRSWSVILIAERKQATALASDSPNLIMTLYRAYSRQSPVRSITSLISGFWAAFCHKKFTPRDSLYWFSESEILNHMFARSAHMAGATVILGEDGLMSYRTLSSRGRRLPIDSVSRLLWAILIITRIVSRARFVIQGGRSYPQILDYLISACVVHNPYKSVRDFPVTFFQKPLQDFSKTRLEDGFFFFNQPLYLWYLDVDNYINWILEIIKFGLDTYSRCVLKFHPRDTMLFKQRLRRLVSDDSRITIVDTDEDAESLVHSLPYQTLVSPYSSVLMNVDDAHFKLVCVARLHPEMTRHEDLMRICAFMTDTGIHCPDTWEQLHIVFANTYKQNEFAIVNSAQVSLNEFSRYLKSQ
jgi:hypothetical protein